MTRTFHCTTPAIAVVAMLCFASLALAADPLPSWNDGAAKQSIVKFVEGVTREGSPDFVPVPERIATFDNDGTLWAEQPIYTQIFFLMDRIKALAPPASGVDGPRSRSPPCSRATARHHGGRRSRRRRAADGHAFRHDDGRVQPHCQRLDRDREASEDRPAVHGHGLPAHARAAGLPARQRLQDLHRLRRRHRVHAALDGKGLRHPARAGDRHRAAASSST